MTALLVLLVAVFLFSSNIIHAQEIGLDRADNLGLIKTNEKDPRDLLVNIVKYLITFLGLIAVIMVMYSGFLWMTSNGDPEKINKAKRTLINSIIGLIIVLSAFAIVTFVANMMNGGGGHSVGSGSNPQAPHGYGVIGACSVESVYPEPGQKDVPRDTAIIVSFKEEVDINTISDGSGHIDSNVLKIFHKNEEDTCLGGGICSSLVSDAVIATTDNKTFVISPSDYLGSPSEYIWYSVYLSNDIEKLSDGSGIFSNCQSDFLRWDFEISNKLDMNPPQVKENGVFPEADNNKDDLVSVDAVQATGNIQIINNPNIFVPATVGSISANPNVSVNIDIGDVCVDGGNYTIDISSSDLTQARLRRETTLLGVSLLSDNQVNFPLCNISLTLQSGTFEQQCSGGCVWDFSITPSHEADTLTIGSGIYEFGKDIVVGSDINSTAQSLNNFINAVSSDLSSSVSANIVNLTAIIAGKAGNNILLDTNNTANIHISPMSGGVDSGKSYNIQGQKDKARNAIIQINFNEAINPLTVSGGAEDLVSYLRVKCFQNDGVTPCVLDQNMFSCGTDTCIKGHFEISNQYKTIEFISNNQCGVNSCGENIYCLPGDTNLLVEVEAANLLTCPPTDCSAKSPYNNCVGGICEDTSGHKFPKASFPLSGVVDLSSNSLDGNRDTFAIGPLNFYNENNPNPNDGDSYKWSFYINDLIDLGAPKIDNIKPKHNSSDVDLRNPLEIIFSKLMMSSSLRSGQTNISNGKDYYRHKLINLWNFADLPLGFWISSENIDISSPLDGISDKTNVFIKHSPFYETVSYRSQIGSGVKDIYQNCFKPSDGPDCSPNEVHPNCCPNGSNLNAVDNSGIDNGTGNCL